MISRRVFPTLLGCAGLLVGCNKPAIETYRVPKETTAQATPPHAHGSAPAAEAASGRAAPTAPAAQAPASAGSSMANTPVATASGAALTWTAPANWKNKPGSAMRKGSYSVAGEGGEADMSITAFPGNVGGELANLNRWRDQLKQPPVSQAELDSHLQRIERNGLKMAVVDIGGTGADGKPARTLGAMVPHGGATWYFKLTGPDALVAKEKPAFLSLLDTVKPADSAK